MVITIYYSDFCKQVLKPDSRFFKGRGTEVKEIVDTITHSNDVTKNYKTYDVEL